AAPGALTFTTWNTGAPQQPGMWFQVELPEAVRLAEIQFESPGGRGAGGRGRGGAATQPGGPTPATAGAAAAAPAAAGNAARGGQAQPAGEAPAPQAFEQPPAAYPRGHKVEVSMDGQTWTTIAEGPGLTARGTGMTTVIRFDPVQAKFVKITQTATAEPPTNWSIQRLRLYEVQQQ